MKLLIAVLQHYDHLIHLDFQCGRISQPTTSGSNSASISSKIHLECTQDAIHGLVHNILWPQNARSHIYTLHWRPGLQGYWESISISTTSERETFLWATCRCRPHHARWLGLGKRGSKSNGLGMCVQTLSLPVVTYQYISWVSGGIVIQKKMLRHEKTLTPHYICRWLPKLKAHAERKLVVHDMTSCTGKWNSQFIQKTIFPTTCWKWLEGRPVTSSPPLSSPDAVISSIPPAGRGSMKPSASCPMWPTSELNWIHDMSRK